MRKILTFLFAALMSVSMFALTPQSGDTWDEGTKTLTVNSNPGSYTYFKSDIENLVISDAVTSIGDHAFEECSALTSVTFGNSVTSIGGEAFTKCTGLTSITIPNSVTSIGDHAFEECSALTSVTFGNSVTSIGVGAFSGCSGLTSITIPNSVTGIGMMAFYGCVGLTSVTIGNSVTSIGKYAFSRCSGLTSVTIGNSVTSIGDEAFSQCVSLTSITIPNSVTGIGMMAFAYCTGLTSITIPNSVTSFGMAAFAGCASLTSIVVASGNTTYDSRDNCNAIIETSSNTLIAGCNNTIIPNSVTSIGFGAFAYCTGLTSITIPNSVTSIGQMAFLECSGLASVTILAESLESYGGSAFEGTAAALKIYVPAGSVATYKVGWADYADKIVAIPPEWLLPGDEWDDATKTLTVKSNLPEEAYKGQTVIEHVIISNSVTSVGNSAFDGCTGLTSITIPNSVTSIGYATFAGCTGLTEVTIPNGITSIGNAAFYECRGLTSIEIPNSVTSIGNLAFRYCSGLETVTILAESLESYGTNAFQGTAAALKIYVPAGSVDTYKAGWTAYADKIVAIGGGEPEPAGQEITPYVDPQNASVYYSTFYDSANKYALPEGVEAYVATIGENVLNLTKIAVADQVIPNDNAVILKSTVASFTLTPSEAAPVTFTATNSLQGTDVAKATPANCYVLSCENNQVGFYQYSGEQVAAHKAYVLFSGSNAPRRMPFIFDQATGVENVQGNVQSTKVLRDGQLIIIRNGVEYNANGMMVK